MVTGDNALSALPISFLSSVFLLSPLAASFLPLLMLINLCERISQGKGSGCETDQYILPQPERPQCDGETKGNRPPQLEAKNQRSAPKYTESHSQRLLPAARRTCTHSLPEREMEMDGPRLSLSVQKGQANKRSF